jgi:hypothetical protein
MFVEAELGPQVPLIQVRIPIRGKTHICRMIHRATIPIGTKNSINLPPQYSIERVLNC